jgi:anaerobic selenocysteine-containing dehydrogenase
VEGAVETADFVQKLAGLPETLADLLKARVDAISKAKRGTILTLADGKTTAAAEVADPWKAFEQGAVWTDDARPDSKMPRLTPQVAVVQPPPTAEGFPLTLVPFGWRGANGPASPLYTKLYQESGVRDAVGVARINPATAQAHTVCDGGKVKVETRGGSAVIQPVLRRCDADALPAYLETTKERNVGFYEQHGFAVVGHARLPLDGPPMWFMWREPR